jgi:hypothetical protein|nr:MAG TPA: hypothetical protein [Caudoviricetes sp.]
MILKKEKAMDLLIRYLKFTKEEAKTLKESITSITVNNKATSMDFTILANGCAIFLKRKEGSYEMRITGKGPIKEYTFYLAERTRGILLDAVRNE